MKKYLLALTLCFASWTSLAATPTEAVEKAVTDILEIAQAKDVPAEERRENLEAVIKNYVDLQAASQRVLAKYWKKASKEEKQKFMTVFRKVLTNTYFNLLEQYNNEKVIFGKEEIKKEKYAVVESTVISGGKEIPVNYRLLYRNDTWKLYDFVAEGISMIRSFSSDYKAILKKEGIGGLSIKLEEKLASKN